MIHLLGIDVGTTGTKVVLFDSTGCVIASSLQEYQLLTRGETIVELDPEVYWSSCAGCIRAVLQESHVPPASIKALAISSQGETFVPVDSRSQPLTPAIVWLDNRSSAEARLIAEHFGRDRLYGVTGSPEVVPTWAATKILWLKRNRPEVFAKVWKYLFVEDYIVQRLTGQVVAEPALYTSSLLLDITRWTWWDEMLDFVGVSPSRLPVLVEPGQVVASLTAEAARETGLDKGTAVVTGAMDCTCSSVGSGNIRAGILSETTGAGLSISMTTDAFAVHPGIRVPVQCHVRRGQYLILPWCATAGMVLKWFRDEFCSEEKAGAVRTGADPYDLMAKEAAAVAPGAEGLVMLPHLAGAVCPEFNELARGVIFGLGLNHTRAHLVRAIMEAVALMLKRNTDLIERMGIEVREIRSMGGASKSALWNQIKADVTQKPVLVLDNPEAGCLGAAILAGTAIGLFESVDAACEKLVTIKARTAPVPARREVYARLYERYLALYDCLKRAFWSSE